MNSLQTYKRDLVRKLFLMAICAMPSVTMAQVAGNEASTDTVSMPRTVKVAFGAQSKDQVTSSVSTVSSGELRKTHTSTLSNTLFGRLPGVAALHTAGAPGYDEASLFIRGRHTFVDNGYLVLLDGFQVDGFNQVSVDEIESVSVLKDASALALYGIKGANGAILITTKRGQASDKVNIGFNARYGYQTPAQLPRFAGSYDYARLYNEARVNDGQQPLYTESQLNGYRDGTDPYLYPDVNWYDQVLRKGAPIQDYSLSFNGGGETARYFVLLGYMENQGLYANTDQKRNSNINFERINFRANVDINVTKSLSVFAGLGGTIEDRMFPTISTESLWQNMATYAPNLYPVRTPGGKLTGTAAFPNNPIGSVLEKGFDSRHNRNVQATVRINEKLDFITKGLNAFATVSYNSVFISAYNKTKSYSYYEPIRTTSTAGTDSLYYLPRSTDTDLVVNARGGNSETSRSNVQAGLDYNRVFDQHELSALVMFHQDAYSIMGNQASYALQNLMGRINYGFRQKYFAEVAFSYSGTDNYAPGKRFGFFPAVSAGWLIHKENFWNENSVVNYLKLRASAGLTGNDRNPSRFIYNQYWGESANQGYYFGTGQNFYSGLVELVIANPDITWEKSLSYNFGIETSLLNNKLSLTADVFYENRYDILVNMGNTTPSLAGYTLAAIENRGEVQNYGTEISAMFRNKAGRFSYFIGGQFAFARNKIIENYEVPRKEAYSSRKNNPVGQYFGMEAIGFFKDENDIIASPVQTFSTVRPGDLKYKDQNGDNIIDINDEVPIGRHSYPEISYALNAGVAYRGFDLEVLFQGTGNRSVYLDGYMFWPFINNANISPWAVEGHWTPETHASATFPRLSAEPNANNYRASTFWVRNVNMISLRNIELGYTLSNNLFPRTRIQNLRVYASALNPFRWDNLAVDVDPETLGRGYPVLKTYTIGLSLNF
jgi:TonB-linked SusC/RagA family outer membrane protein